MSKKDRSRNSDLRLASENLQGPSSSASNNAHIFDKNRPVTTVVLRLWGSPGANFSGILKLFCCP